MKNNINLEEYIKQLENENKMLKSKLQNELKNHTTEQLRLKMKNDLLKKELFTAREKLALFDIY